MKYLYFILSFINCLKQIPGKFPDLQMIKSMNDQSKYRHLVLKNQMDVILIQNSDKTQGARLRVDAGSNHESFNKYNGLAHLLEHVLYNGNPSSQEKLTDHLAKNNGDCNAITNDMETEYYFTVEKQLEKALKIWAQGFNEAQIQESDISREIAAVNSEYINAQSEEQWHYQEQLRLCANKQHPFSRFNIGNYKTLPLTELKELTNQARQFYKKYYTSDRMHLMIISRENLDDQQKMVEKIFGNFKSDQKSHKEQFDISFNKDDLGKFVWISSKKQQNQLALVFTLPKQLTKKNQGNSGVQFIKKLLEQPDESGFLFKLQKKNWIIDFQGGYVWTEPTDKDLLQIKFLLTDIGMDNSLTIIKHFFQHINSLEKIISNKETEQLYNQFSLLSFVNFYYQDKYTTDKYLTEFHNWHKYSQKEKYLVNENNVYQNFMEEYLKEVLSLIEPQNCLIIFSSNKLKKDNKFLRFKQFKKVSDKRYSLRSNNKLKNNQLRFKQFKKKDNLENIFKEFQNDFIQIDEKTQQQQNHKSYLFQKMSAVKSLLGNKKKEEIGKQELYLIQKPLQKYNEIMNYYYNEEQINDDYLQQFEHFRQKIISSEIKLKPLKYLTKDLNIVSNCPQISIINYQVSKNYQFTNQEKIPKPTQFTSHINIMLEYRTQTRYELQCFQNDILQDSKIKQLINNNFTQIFLQTNRAKMLPKTQFVANLQSPYIHQTQLDNHKYHAMCLMFQDYIQSEEKQMEQAGNVVQINDNKISLNFAINCFSDQLKPIQNYLIKSLKNGEFINEQSFSMAKLYIQIQQDNKLSLSKHIQEVFKEILQLQQVDNKSEFLKDIQDLQLSDMKQYHEMFIQNLFIKQLYSGNILSEQVQQLSENIMDILDLKNPVQQKVQQKEQIIKLQNLTNIIFRDFNKIEEDKNHAVLNYYQINSKDPNFDQAVLLFLDNFLQTQSFKFLREINNLGYIAQAQATNKLGVLGIVIYVQGYEKDPIEMEQYIEKFLNYFYDFIEKIPDGEFSQSRFKQGKQQDSIKKHIKQTIKKFEQNNVKTILEQQQDQLQAKDLIKRNQIAILYYLQSITKQDILTFWKDQLIQNKKKISVQMFSQKQYEKIPDSKEQNETLYMQKFDPQNYQSY